MSAPSVDRLSTPLVRPRRPELTQSRDDGPSAWSGAGVAVGAGDPVLAAGIALLRASLRAARGR